MNKTQNYQLSLWDKTDRLLMADFNEDNGKIDAALAALQSGKANAADLTSTASTLQTAIGGKASFVTGSYAGDGNTNRTIVLDFRPKVVIVATNMGVYNDTAGYYGGIFVDGISSQCMQFVGNGFIPFEGTGYSAIHLNGQNMTYHYIAFR